MRYSQLKAFHSVALYGGFSRASEAILLTQPALSEHVRRLEQDHDVLLFHREKKRVQLTEAGVQLFNLTKRLFELEQQIKEFLSEKSAVVEGTLRIIIDSASHISDTLGRFRSENPNVFVSVRTGNTDEMISELRAYNAEIAIVGSINPGNDLEMIDLGSTPVNAFAAQGYLPKNTSSLSLRELSTFPLVFREPGSKTRQMLEEEAIRQKIKLNPVMEVEGREAMRDIVASGVGIGFVSDAEFGNDNRLVRIPIKGSYIQMTETLIYLSQRRDLKIIRSFVEFVKSDIHPKQPPA